MTTDEINAIAERTSELTVSRLLAALGLGGSSSPITGIYLHSLSCQEFGICVEHHAETIRELIRCRSAKMPRSAVSGKHPYKLDATKLLPLWNVEPSLAIARLAAAKRQPQEQIHEPAAQRLSA